MNAIVQSICARENLQLLAYKAVAGGDINHAFIVETRKGSFFLKCNQLVLYPDFFAAEADGLNALAKATTLKIPQPISYGQIDDAQYLLLEWLENGLPSNHYWQQLAYGLAELHKNTQADFGWSRSNYIGTLVQQNTAEKSWANFYAHQRIMPLVNKMAQASILSTTDVKLAEAFCNKLTDIFPAEPPAMLHGDLWAGNCMPTVGGLPAIYDPAVYFGHREMDIAMTLLFGGFDRVFYQYYQEAFPLENGWQQRSSAAQLYPLLVHAVLFGGGYINQCRQIMKEWA